MNPGKGSLCKPQNLSCAAVSSFFSSSVSFAQSAPFLTTAIAHAPKKLTNPKISLKPLQARLLMVFAIVAVRRVCRASCQSHTRGRNQPGSTMLCRVPPRLVDVEKTAQHKPVSNHNLTISFYKWKERSCGESFCSVASPLGHRK